MQHVSGTVWHVALVIVTNVELMLNPCSGPSTVLGLWVSPVPGREQHLPSEVSQSKGGKPHTRVGG